MSPPDSSVKLTQDSKQIGLRFALSIESVLRRLRLDRVSVLEKDRERLNKCYAPGHPDYTEYEGDFLSSEAYRFLDTMANGLRQNPLQRTFIVDHSDAKYTEDSVWLSLPKWQHDYDLPSVYWHVVTERSIEKSVFREVFSECEWNVEHDDGPRGTSFVSKYVYVDENDGPEAQKVFKRHYGTLFSDQPEVVAQQGLECGAELYRAAARFGTFPKPVVRIFRCAPREPLIEGITGVIKQQLTDNVFNIWIRHSEAPEKMLQGFGKYEFQVDDTSKSPLELLTSIHVSEEVADDGTVVSIPSPLSSDTYPVKTSMFVSVPKDSSEMENGSPGNTAGVSPLNGAADMHIDSTATPRFSVEAVLTPSMSTPSTYVADTPKRGSARRTGSSNSETDEDLSTPSKVETEQSEKGMSQKTPRKSPTLSPMKKGSHETTPQESPVSRDSTSVSKDEEAPDELDHTDKNAEEPVHTGKKTQPRKKRSKKKSKSPTRSQKSPSASFQEEKKDVDDESRDLNRVDSPSSSITTGNVLLKEPQKTLICSSCKKDKKKHEYSKAQLRKKEERRCVDCIQNNI